MKARRFVVALAAATAVALLVSSGSFSSVDAERGVSVAVADDQSAFVGVETHPRTLTAGPRNRTTLLTVTNNFDVRAHVRNVDLGGGGPPAPKVKDLATTKDRLDPDNSTNVTGKVKCGIRSEEVTVDITVETVTGTYVSLSRKVEITCTTPTDRGRRAAREKGETPVDEGSGAENPDERGKRSHKGNKGEKQ